MLGLGAYESSSEDEIKGEPSNFIENKRQSQPLKTLSTAEDEGTPVPDQEQKRVAGPPLPESSGPVLGPSNDGVHPSSLTPTEDQSLLPSTSRALVHDLTLPPVPNFSIPPSPPGSPDPAADAKFSHFLSLKKQGVHFNEKLAGSTSLKNPSLLQKLMAHAGIDGQAQYNTTLPPYLWDTLLLPNWGFKEELLKSQKGVQHKSEQKRIATQRDSIDFVSPAPLESNK